MVLKPADSSTVAEYAEEVLAAPSRACPASSALSADVRGTYLHRVGALAGLV